MKRLKISKNGYYFNCYVFDSVDSVGGMYRFYSRLYKRVYGKEGREGNERNFRAVVLPMEKYFFDGGDQVLQKHIGTCLFWRGNLGAGLIAHEMLHCAMWYDRLINKNKLAEYGDEVGEREERLAYLLMDFTAEFVKKSIRLKLW